MKGSVSNDDVILTQPSIKLSQLAQLRRRDLAAAELIRNHQTKFDMTGAQAVLKSVLGGRGKRYNQE